MNDKMSRDPSDSAVQLVIERAMLDYFRESHPNWRPVAWQTVAYELGLPPVWQKAKPDAAWQDDEGRIVIAECYARIDELKTGHRRKLALDALKLLSLRNAVTDPNQLRCLLIVPEEIDRQLQADSWLSVAIRQAAEVVAVRLTNDQRQQLREAVKLQGAGQARILRAGAE